MLAPSTPRPLSLLSKREKHKHGGRQEGVKVHESELCKRAGPEELVREAPLLPRTAQHSAYTCGGGGHSRDMPEKVTGPASAYCTSATIQSRRKPHSPPFLTIFTFSPWPKAPKSSQPEAHLVESSARGCRLCPRGWRGRTWSMLVPCSHGGRPDSCLAGSCRGYMARESRAADPLKLQRCVWHHEKPSVL